jgi:hypothetical protein
MRTGLVELIKHRGDLLNVFGILVHVPNNIDQRKIFGTQLFLPFFYPLGQLFKFLFISLLNSLVHLLTEIGDWQ